MSHDAPSFAVPFSFSLTGAARLVGLGAALTLLGGCSTLGDGATGQDRSSQRAWSMADTPDGDAAADAEPDAGADVDSSPYEPDGSMLDPDASDGEVLINIPDPPRTPKGWCRAAPNSDRTDCDVTIDLCASGIAKKKISLEGITDGGDLVVLECECSCVVWNAL